MTIEEKIKKIESTLIAVDADTEYTTGVVDGLRAALEILHED